MMTLTLPNDESNIQFEKTMLAMVTFGIGEIVGCIFIGRVIDKMGSKKAVYFTSTIVILMTAVTLAFIIIGKFNFLAFLLCFMWGL